jgi:hypothetical protein
LPFGVRQTLDFPSGVPFEVGDVETGIKGFEALAGVNAGGDLDQPETAAVTGRRR